MKTRDQIEEKYKWELDMFKTQEEIENVFATIEKLTKILPTYYGKFNDKDIFFEYFNDYKEDFLKIDKLSFYISNSWSVDSANTEILKLSDRLTYAMDKLNKATAFFEPQIDDLDEDYLKSLLNDPRAKNLDVKIKEILKNKPHKLDEKTSEILSKLSNSFNNSSTIHSLMESSELQYEDAVDCAGKKHKVDNSSYITLVSSNDKVLRKSAFNSHMSAFENFNKTFAELYLSSVKSDLDFNKLRNFKSTLECELSGEDVPKSVFDKNIEQVNKYIPILQDFVKTQAKLNNQKDFAYYDLFEDKKIDGKISVEDAQNIMLKALVPLGDEYMQLVKKKLNDKSIDYMPNKNKNAGGYCANNYDTKTVILMNWTYDFSSLSTLTHEMGHCINAEYFNSAQPMEKAGITIFAAEIASTVNELLLGIYMQNNCRMEEKAYYIHEFLDNARSTIFRQTLFSEFELFAHTSVQNEQPITYQDLNDKYFELNKKYYGNACILPEKLKYEWSKVPHFYNSFYVYCYSTGLITAINIVKKILNDNSYVEKYIKFLKNGLNKPAFEILKEIGIDLSTDEPYKLAFKFFKEQLELYKSLTK